jgi:hypothetical protein
MALESRTADHARFACWSRRKASGWRFTGSHAAYPLHGGWKKGRRTWTRTRSVDCGPCSRPPPVPPEQAPTGSGSNRLWILGGTLVACLRPSGPSPPPKDARFGRLACLCRPGLIHSVPPVQCQPLEFPAYELSEVWLRCCLYPGRHICADGPAHDLASRGRSRHSFYSHPQSVIHFVSFRSCSSSSSSSNRTPARCSQQTCRKSPVSLS